ncbi:MAG: iron ABC transporter substrate-binding protein, partial [Pseudomonadota bacterium]
MKKTLIGIVATLLLSSAAYAEAVVESCDRTVTFDDPPSAAISNDVNLTEMMLVLGLTDRMVGYTGISGWKTLDEEMRAGVEALPELSEKYPTKEVLIG